MTRKRYRLRKEVKYILKVAGIILATIVLGIVIIVYISYAEEDFNGTICSLFIFPLLFSALLGLLIFLLLEVLFPEIFELPFCVDLEFL